MKSLKSLNNYTDIDLIGFMIAKDLGIIDDKYNYHLDCKHVFNSKNIIGDLIYEFIEDLVKNGVLEEDPDNFMKLRWNPKFKGSWEK